MAGMALHPHPFDMMLRASVEQCAPQILVPHRLLLAVLPTVFLPADHPAGDPVKNIFAVGGHNDIARLNQQLQRLDRGGEILGMRDQLFQVVQHVKLIVGDGPDQRFRRDCRLCGRREREQAERALLLLHRYTDQGFLYAAEWRVWLDANQGRLYFTDTGGYKFKPR